MRTKMLGLISSEMQAKQRYLVFRRIGMGENLFETARSYFDEAVAQRAG
jgi:hypothetical protein